MNNERKLSKGERAADGLREATAKDEAKNESKTGHDLAKGADRFEERSKSSDGRSAQEKQKGGTDYTADAARRFRATRGCSPYASGPDVALARSDATGQGGSGGKPRTSRTGPNHPTP